VKIEYDPAHDVLNIEFLTEESIAESVELDGIIIDTRMKGKSLPSRYLTCANVQQ